LKVYFDTRFNR